MRKALVVLILATLSNVSRGECLPTPCYVESIRVESCRAVRGISMETSALRKAGLERGRAERILRSSEAVVVRGGIRRSRSLLQCGEAYNQRLTETPEFRDYLLLDAACDDLPVGHVAEGFVSEPCCDTLPVDSPECVLGLEIFGRVPGWAQQE
jgi:hypothetical protein